MREPPFWWRKPGAAAQLLAPIAAGYGLIAAARLRRAGQRAAVPVVCVGNLTVGGGGKTPTAIAVARLFLRAGLRPVFLTRGYGGVLAGPVRVGANARAAEVGDEPLLLARVAPTIVARNRVAGAAAAVQENADVIVMDDGLQNPSLVKDAAIVALDGRRGVGNARGIPAGPLRAPLDIQLGRVHALLVVGDAAASASAVIDEARRRGLQVFAGRLEPDATVAADLKNRRLLAFAGIADPGKFFATLAQAGLAVAAAIDFPDHHPYSSADAARLIARAKREDLQLVTTEKDAARLQGNPALSELAARSKPFPVALVVAQQQRLRAFLRERTSLPI